MNVSSLALGARGFRLPSPGPVAAFIFATGAFWALYSIWLGLRLGGEEGLRYLSDVVYEVPLVVATVTLGLAALSSSGRRRLGWAMAAAGMGAWAAGEWAWSSYDLFFRAEAPLPSVADPLYYLGYIGMMTGLVLLVEPATGSHGAGKSFLDALIVIISLAAFSWHWVLAPVARMSEVSRLGIGITLGYPLMDLGMVAVVIAALYRANWRLPTPVILLAVAELFSAVCDTLYLHLSAVQEYDPTGNPVELGWVVAYSLSGIAGFLHWQRSGAAAQQPSARAASQSRVGLALPYALALPLLALLIHGVATGSSSLVVAVGATLVVACVGLRQWFTLAENATLYEQVPAQDRERRLLLDNIVRAREQERQRVALELHDKPIQALSTVALRLSACHALLARGEADRCASILEEAEDRLNSETHGLRQLMSELHPPVLDERGVGAAIADYCENFARETGIAVQAETADVARLQASVETVLYRIAQEALANVRRHAQARTVQVSLSTNGDAVELRVHDDGVGFVPREPSSLAKEGHFGLLSIRQRAELANGTCSIESTPGAGTTLTVSVPAQMVKVP